MKSRKGAALDSANEKQSRQNGHLPVRMPGPTRTPPGSSRSLAVGNGTPGATPPLTPKFRNAGAHPHDTPESESRTTSSRSIQASRLRPTLVDASTSTSTGAPDLRSVDSFLMGITVRIIITTPRRPTSPAASLLLYDVPPDLPVLAGILGAVRSLTVQEPDLAAALFARGARTVTAALTEGSAEDKGTEHNVDTSRATMYELALQTGYTGKPGECVAIHVIMNSPTPHLLLSGPDLLEPTDTIGLATVASVNIYDELHHNGLASLAASAASGHRTVGPHEAGSSAAPTSTLPHPAAPASPRTPPRPASPPRATPPPASVSAAPGSKTGGSTGRSQPLHGPGSGQRTLSPGRGHYAYSPPPLPVPSPGPTSSTFPTAATFFAQEAAAASGPASTPSNAAAFFSSPSSLTASQAQVPQGQSPAAAPPRPPQVAAPASAPYLFSVNRDLELMSPPKPRPRTTHTIPFTPDGMTPRSSRGFQASPQGPAPSYRPREAPDLSSDTDAFREVSEEAEEPSHWDAILAIPIEVSGPPVAPRPRTSPTRRNRHQRPSAVENPVSPPQREAAEADAAHSHSHPTPPRGSGENHRGMPRQSSALNIQGPLELEPSMTTQQLLTAAGIELWSGEASAAASAGATPPYPQSQRPSEGAHRGSPSPCGQLESGLSFSLQAAPAAPVVQKPPRRSTEGGHGHAGKAKPSPSGALAGDPPPRRVSRRSITGAVPRWVSESPPPSARSTAGSVRWRQASPAPITPGSSRRSLIQGAADDDRMPRRSAPSAPSLAELRYADKYLTARAAIWRTSSPSMGPLGMGHAATAAAATADGSKGAQSRADSPSIHSSPLKLATFPGGLRSALVSSAAQAPSDASGTPPRPRTSTPPEPGPSAPASAPKTEPSSPPAHSELKSHPLRINSMLDDNEDDEGSESEGLTVVIGTRASFDMEAALADASATPLAAMPSAANAKAKENLSHVANSPHGGRPGSGRPPTDRRFYNPFLHPPSFVEPPSERPSETFVVPMESESDAVDSDSGTSHGPAPPSGLGGTSPLGSAPLSTVAVAPASVLTSRFAVNASPSTAAVPADAPEPQAASASYPPSPSSSAAAQAPSTQSPAPPPSADTRDSQTVSPAEAKRSPALQTTPPSQFSLIHELGSSHALATGQVVSPPRHFALPPPLSPVKEIPSPASAKEIASPASTRGESLGAAFVLDRRIHLAEATAAAAAMNIGSPSKPSDPSMNESLVAELVNLLQTPEERAQAAALNALLNMSYSNAPSREVIAAGGVIPHLAALITGTNVRLADLSARLLGNVALTDKAREQLSIAIPAILSVLGGGAGVPGARGPCVACLSKLAAESFDCREAILASGGPAVLNTFLAFPFETPEGLAGATGTLAALAEHSFEGASAVAASGVGPRLCSLVSYDKDLEPSARGAIGALRAMLEGGKGGFSNGVPVPAIPASTLLTESQLASKLYAVIREGATRQIRAGGAVLLALLAQLGGSDALEELGRGGAVRLLKEAIPELETTPTALLEVVRALAAFARNERTRPLAVQATVLATIAHADKLLRDDPRAPPEVSVELLRHASNMVALSLLDMD